jgi:hypothetical protein
MKRRICCGSAPSIGRFDNLGSTWETCWTDRDLISAMPQARLPRASTVPTPAQGSRWAASIRFPRLPCPVTAPRSPAALAARMRANRSGRGFDARVSLSLTKHLERRARRGAHTGPRATPSRPTSIPTTPNGPTPGGRHGKFRVSPALQPHAHTFGPTLPRPKIGPPGNFPDAQISRRAA